MSTESRSSGTAKKIAAIVVSLLLIPLILGLFLFPLLQEQPFDSAEELTPESIKSFRVFILNRKELDGGEDIGPYFAAEADYDKLLLPLRTVPEVSQFQDARGPWLGEFRIQLKNGRKGTIRMYWVRTPGDERNVPAFGSVFGASALGYAITNHEVPPVRLRFQIGEHKFEGETVSTVIRIAAECRARGKSAK